MKLARWSDNGNPVWKRWLKRALPYCGSVDEFYGSYMVNANAHGTRSAEYYTLNDCHYRAFGSEKKCIDWIEDRARNDGIFVATEEQLNLL